MEAFINEYCLPNPPLIIDVSETAGRNENSSLLEQPFTEKELDIVMNALNKKSSPGLDEITNEMLFHLPKSFKKILLITINEIFDKGEFPAD